MLSDIRDHFAAKWTAILSFSDPLLNALCVEDVLFVTVERRHEIIAQEIAPADGALTPEAVLAIVNTSTLRPDLSLLVLILCLVQRRDNFRNGKWDGK